MSPAPKRDVLVSGVEFDKELKSGSVSILEVAPIAKRLGAKGFEYREVYWKDKAKELPTVRDQIAQLGMKVTYATFHTLFDRDPEKQAMLMQDLEDAHALGAPLMRVFRGERPTTSADDAQMVAAARAVVDRAGVLGMRLALENFSGLPGSRPEELHEVLEIIDSPVMGINIDFANYAANLVDPIAAIKQFASHVIYAHLKDAKPPVESRNYVYLGDGMLPLPQIMAALDALQGDLLYCFEFPC
ncbi:MAG TPA: TIM barrel protein, partial [Chloroflexota bacterium]|nr:TIM barrel protein [Chloroflexota bacterium]